MTGFAIDLDGDDNQEVLVVTARDLTDALHGDRRLGLTVLRMLAAYANDGGGSVLVKIDFPGRFGAGGFEATPRRMRRLARWLWGIGTTPLHVPREG